MTITPRFRAAPERFAGGPSQGCQVPRCSPRCHLPALQPTGARRAADHGRSCSPEPCQTSASQLFWHFQALGWVTEGSRASRCLERVVEPPGLAGWGQRSEQTGPACSTQLFQRAAVLGRPTLPPRRPQQICWAFCLSAWGETPSEAPAVGGGGWGCWGRRRDGLPASAGPCFRASECRPLQHSWLHEDGGWLHAVRGCLPAPGCRFHSMRGWLLAPWYLLPPIQGSLLADWGSLLAIWGSLPATWGLLLAIWGSLPAIRSVHLAP